MTFSLWVEYESDFAVTVGSFEEDPSFVGIVFIDSLMLVLNIWDIL